MPKTKLTKNPDQPVQPAENYLSRFTKVLDVVGDRIERKRVQWNAENPPMWEVNIPARDDNPTATYGLRLDEETGVVYFGVKQKNGYRPTGLIRLEPELVEAIRSLKLPVSG